MASHGQTNDDYVGDFPMRNDNPLELFSFDYNGTNFPNHFPFSRPQISPSPLDNLYGFQRNLTSESFCDSDMVTNFGEHNRYPLNNPVNQDVVMRNNMPMLDNQGFSFCSVGAGGISSGFQTSNNNMMSAYQGVNRVPYFDNSHGSIMTNSISANSSGPVKFQSSVVNSETQNRADISRTFTNFSSEPRHEQTILPRVHNDRGRVRSSQPNSEGKIDGRFLSLGYQGEVSSSVNSHGRKAGHHIGNSSVPFQPLNTNSSFNFSRGGSAPVENNVGGSVTPLGNEILCDDYYGMQEMPSEFDTYPIPNRDDGQVKMDRYIPTLNTLSSESGIKSNPIIDLVDPFECSGATSYMLPNVSRYNDGSSWPKQRSMQRASFNSSVLRSTHQIAAEPQHNSHLSTNLVFSPLGTNVGETHSQDKSGLARGFVTESSGAQAQTAESNHLHRLNRPFSAGQIYPSFSVLGRPSTDQGADTSVNNELPCDSTTNNKRLKRIINLHPRATTPNQRRKLLPQNSRQQFSPDLLQNALGQIPIGHSEPANPSVNELNTPNPIKDFAASEWPRNTPSWPPEGITETFKTASPNPIALTQAFVPHIHIPPTNSFTIPVISVDSPSVSQPVNIPPIALARTKASRSGSSSSSVLATSKKRARAANIPTDPRRSNLVHTTSAMNPPVPTDWKRSLSAMAALGHIDPALRASQMIGSMSHIKWQGCNTAPTVGFKCLICKRDLSFSPDGPVTQPPIPPPVAVLSCGHTFHDHCLLRITPQDQSKDPPCIPCAVEN